MYRRFKVRIDRHGNILSQAYKQFAEVSPSKLRGSFAVKFLGEEALDMGGVTKEFFHVVSEQVLDPQANLFIPQGPNNTFHPSPSSAINGSLLLLSVSLLKTFLKASLIPTQNCIWNIFDFLAGYWAKHSLKSAWSRLH